MDNKDYYDKYNWEKANLTEKLKGKIGKIIDLIPSDVETILDIGCGDGAISNQLAKKYKTVSLDRSKKPLEYVKSEPVQASADLLCFPSDSFDMVFSSETIEHLPDEIFYSAISEFKRVGKKYIFLTFPNNENIEKLSTKCLECGTIFNKSYHLRSLNAKIIKELFDEYEIINQFENGAEVRQYNNFISKIKHRYSPAISWIPNYWTRGNNEIRKTMCPNCGLSFTIPYKFNLIAKTCDLINIIITKKIPYQLGILLKKRDV